MDPGSISTAITRACAVHISKRQQTALAPHSSQKETIVM
jgi:hypothetical protein